MDSTSTIFCCLLLLVSGTFGKTIRKNIRAEGPERHGLDFENLPENVAVHPGENVDFTCWVDTVTGNPRIQWWEYATNPSGALVSDGDFISPAHPNADRYELIRVSQRQYDLHIRDVRMGDAGNYVCLDDNAGILEKRRHSAELIVIIGQQNCTTTMAIPPLATIEGTYYSTECETHYRGNIAPYMHWTGPMPFLQAQTTTPTVVWSGMSFYASRIMNNQFWTSRANFTGNFLPAPADSAENIPDFEMLYETDRIIVNWPPQSLYADPVKPLNEYEVGDSMECFADAFPTAQFEWINTRTNERFMNNVFVIPSTWLGTSQVMRCIATNIINGQTFTNELFIQVIVPLPTTTPPTTTPTTTTTAPPVSNCNDLSGRWQSRGPTSALMCLEVDSANGAVNGVMRNATDTFWLDLAGQTDLGGYHHASWTGIWPLNRAVSAFIAECSRCNGVEILLVNVISRTKGGPPCGTPGVIRYSEQYEFVRDAVAYCPPITIPT